MKAGAACAAELGSIPAGRHISNHTLRHSYGRHLLVNNIAINYLLRWLGHSSIQTRCSTWIWCRTRPEAWRRCRDDVAFEPPGDGEHIPKIGTPL